MSRASSPFGAAAVLGLLLVGAGAFLLFLYALGQGWTGDDEAAGGAHAASRGLVGYAALVDMLEAGGRDVSLSRNVGAMSDTSLLVLTPPHFADAEEIARILDERRYTGPTILVLPKWLAEPLDEASAEKAGAGDNWVRLTGTQSPQWYADLPLADGSEVSLGRTSGWAGLGLSGPLARPNDAQGQYGEADLAETSMLEPLVSDTEDDLLIGEYYPPGDDEAWPVIVVFEPDLLNNLGMANQSRAALAAHVFDYADPDTPIKFDLTLAGLGTSENLLTLAFAPPFLAATLCLLMAALVVAWRGFRRFGPAMAEMPALALGKAQLARNGAGLIARVRRWHLLAEPFAALTTARIAATLGLREAGREAREAAIDRALQRRGHGDTSYAKAAHAMRSARGAHEILRGARALKSIERMLKP